MGRIISLIQETIPGVYVKSLEIGSNYFEDLFNGFFLDTNKQVSMVCDQLSKDPQLQGGFHALGFSQGSQFLRAYIQRCNRPRVKNYISLGGQQQGVYGFPNCPGPNITYCETARRLIDYAVYDPWIQSFQVQAQYWHDPLDEALYASKSAFIADINNARPQKNATYKANLQTLNQMVLVVFEQDSVIIPRESSHFGFYAPGQDSIILSMRDTQLYKEDWIGLAALDRSNRVKLLSTKGNHLQFSDSWFVNTIIHNYLL